MSTAAITPEDLESHSDQIEHLRSVRAAQSKSLRRALTLASMSYLTAMVLVMLALLAQRNAPTEERVVTVPYRELQAPPSLQQTRAARPPRARVHRLLLDQLGIHEGAQIRIRQGSGEAVVAVVVDPEVPPGVIRLAAAHASTTALEALSGPVIVERA